MLREKLLAMLIATTLFATSAQAEKSWLPVWLGGTPNKPPTSNNRYHRPTRTKTAQANQKSNSWFSNPFKKKSVTKTADKKPSDKSRIRSTRNEDEKSSWFGGWFQPKEPAPPQSINEWMELEQIKP
jgi:hypothetical protein